MKTIVLFIAFCLLAGNIFASSGIHEALKNPSAVTVITLNGSANEASLLTKNASKFTSLQQIIISGISDSILAEQDLIAVASCSAVKKLSIDNCGFSHLSGALKMLVSVNDLEISDCKNLEMASAFSVVSEMPSLKTISYSTTKLVHMPRSFVNMRGLSKISIHNNDLSLADGYALNNSSRESLLAKESVQLGFGDYILLLEYSCYDKASAKEHITIMRDMLQGVAGMNDDMKLPQRPTAFTRENPLIKPPVPGLDVRKNTYTTNATTGGLVEYPSGTRISIPSNAFVDANGNAINGNVTIDYREFRDPVDIMVSGIPMVYDSAGQKGDFESAGMFELNASVDGKEVFLAPDKKVDMEFAVVDTASTYNFYQLDPSAGWVFQSTTGKVEKKADVLTAVKTTTATTTLARSNAALDFLWRTGSLRNKKPDIRDTTSFDGIYEDTRYFYMTKNKDTLNHSEKKENKIATEWQLHKVSSGNDGYYFSFLNSSKNLNFGSHNPEMSPYRRVIWQLNESLDKKTLKALRSASSGINDFRITYLGESDYSIELKMPDGFVTISATPVYINWKKQHLPISVKRCKQMDRQYTKILNGRRRNFNGAIHHRVYLNQKWEYNMRKDSLKQWSLSKQFMTAEEKNMDFGSWVTYSKKYIGFNSNDGGQVSELYAQNNAICQSLSIMKFGVYNCDQIKRINNPVQVAALAYSKDNIPQNANQMFIIQNKKNQAFSYSGYSGGPILIAFGAREENKLIVINADGTISLTNVEMFNARKQTPQGNTRFETVTMSDKPVSTEELRKFIYPEKEAKQ